MNEKPSKSRVFHDKYKQKVVIAKEKFSPVHDEKKQEVIKIQDNDVKIPLNCGICHVDYREKEDYKLHFKEQHPENFFCEFCYEIFSTVGSLMQHISKVHEEIKLKVKECNFKSDFNKSDSKKDPIDVQTNFEETITKGECNSFLSTGKTRKYSKKHACQICNEWFATKCILRRHSASVHEIKKSSTNKKNDNFDSIIDPLDVSNNLSKRNLQTSASIEKSGKRSKTRPHKCKKCDAEFNKESHLKDHNAAIHEEKRPHKCKMCSLAFSFSTDLINHVTVVHDRKKPKPYIVNVGEKRGGFY